MILKSNWEFVKIRHDLASRAKMLEIKYSRFDGKYYSDILDFSKFLLEGLPVDFFKGDNLKSTLESTSDRYLKNSHANSELDKNVHFDDAQEFQIFENFISQLQID